MISLLSLKRNKDLIGAVQEFEHKMYDSGKSWPVKTNIFFGNSLVSTNFFQITVVFPFKTCLVFWKFMERGRFRSLCFEGLEFLSAPAKLKRSWVGRSWRHKVYSLLTERWFAGESTWHYSEETLIIACCLQSPASGLQQLMTASAEGLVHCSTLLTEDQAEMIQYHRLHPGSKRTAPIISISAKPEWGKGRIKQHLALPGVRKEDVNAIAKLGETAYESSSCFHSYRPDLVFERSN